MAAIDSRSGSWRVRWRYGGTRSGAWQTSTWADETLAIQCKKLSEAHNHEVTAEAVEAIILGTPSVQEQSDLMTVEEWAEKWLSSRTRISPGQRDRYRSQLQRVILPAIGHIPLDRVTGMDVVGVLQAIRDAGLSDATATRYYSLMHSLFGAAVREKIIDDNPAARTDWVRGLIADDDTRDDGDDHVYLSPAEYQMIRANMAPDALPLLELLAGTGVRWGEATAVKVGAVALDESPALIRVHRAWKMNDRAKVAEGEDRWYLGATKGRTRRTLTIAPSLAGLLRPLVETLGPVVVGREEEELLVTAPEGGRVIYSNWRNRRWLPALAAAARCPTHPPLLADGTADQGLLAVSACDCRTRLRQWPTIHDLRHSHAAWLIAAGQPIAAVSRRLGHRTTEITELIYAGILPQTQADIADALESALTAPGGGPAR